MIQTDNKNQDQPITEDNFELCSNDSSDEEIELSLEDTTSSVRDYYTVHSNSDFLNILEEIENEEKSSTSNTSCESDKNDFFEDDYDVLGMKDENSCGQKSERNNNNTSTCKKSSKVSNTSFTKFHTESTTSKTAPIKNFHCAHASMQGHRPTMEDDFCVDSHLHYNLYALMDGHCGSQASYLTSRKLFNHFKQIATETGLPFNVDLTEEKKMKQVLVKSIAAMDDELFDIFTETDEEIYDGCTLIWLVHDTKKHIFHVANLGDSRILISQGSKRIFMTKDHKPTDAEEMDRIYDCGGFVANDRVNGNLALSRALGDFEYKKRPYKLQNMLGFKGDVVSIEPKITHLRASPECKLNEFNKNEPINILIACDGVFDVYDDFDTSDTSDNEEGFFTHKSIYQRGYGTIEELIDLIDECMKDGKTEGCSEDEKLEMACKKVMLSAFDLGSTDNISVMLVNIENRF